ncbi:MAG: hypothetical protein OHK0056_18300 [Bacteriovoracaceae bacterium]
MLDHLTNIQEASLWAIPWLAFMTGFGGSLHCAGMCGGLTLAASGSTKGGIFWYQLGRLISYFILGLVSGFIGSKLQLQMLPKNIFLVTSIFLGLFFIFWGVSVWKKQNLDIKLPQFANRSLQKGWKYFFNLPKGSLRSAGVGFFSIFLPCGFLYGAVFAVALLQNPLLSGMAMIFFWLGTVPSLIFAPTLMQKFLNPIAKRVPRLTSLMLISLGVGTIVIRMINFYGQTTGHSCH